MTPLAQTILDTGNPAAQGNCLQAALASLLDLPLGEVPHFVQMDSDGEADWWEAMYAWLADRGLWLQLTEPDPGEHYLVFGKTVRGTTHAVVYCDGELAHDPHPSGAGVLGGWQNPYVIRRAQGVTDGLGDPTDDARHARGLT